MNEHNQTVPGLQQAGDALAPRERRFGRGGARPVA